MANAFADAGARLAVASNEADACHALAADLRGRGSEAIGVPTEVGDTAQLDRLLDTTTGTFGAVDVLVCNAGIPGPVGSMGDATAAEREALFAVNFVHPLHLATRTAPHMAANGGGSIIVTASIAGLRGNARIGLYGLTKATLAQLARNLAVEWVRPVSAPMP